MAHPIDVRQVVLVAAEHACAAAGVVPDALACGLSVRQLQSFARLPEIDAKLVAELARVAGVADAAK